MVKIKSRVLCALLAFSIFISTSASMCFDSYATGGDIIIGGAAVSAGEAVAFLLGVFGLTAASAAVYDNVDSIKAWGNKQLEAFTADTVGKLADPNAQATARADIATWIEDARKGLIDNSSVVWSYWKQWAGSLTTQTIEQTTGGVGGLPAYASLATDSAVVSAFQLNITDSSDPIYIIVVDNDSNGIAYELLSLSFFKGTYYDGYYHESDEVWARSWVDYDSSGKRFDYYYDTLWLSDRKSNHSILFDLSIAQLPRETGIPPTDVFHEFWVNNVLNPPVVETPDYTLSPTGLSDVYERDHSYDNVGLVNPGAVAGNPGITIDWGKVGDIAGVLGGIAAGELDGTEALERVGVTVVDHVTDRVIDDTGVTDIPIADVVVDTTAIDDYTIPGLQTLFPFCLPFDLIDFLNILSAPPEAPHFQIPIRYPTGSGWMEYLVDIDLSAFDSVAMILRNMELLAFIVGLIILTRDKMIRG